MMTVFSHVNLFTTMTRQWLLSNITNVQMCFHNHRTKKTANLSDMWAGGGTAGGWWWGGKCRVMSSTISLSLFNTLCSSSTYHHTPTPLLYKGGGGVLAVHMLKLALRSGGVQRPIKRHLSPCKGREGRDVSKSSGLLPCLST